MYFTLVCNCAAWRAAREKQAEKGFLLRILSLGKSGAKVATASATTCAPALAHPCKTLASLSTLPFLSMLLMIKFNGNVTVRCESLLASADISASRQASCQKTATRRNTVSPVVCPLSKACFQVKSRQVSFICVKVN